MGNYSKVWLTFDDRNGKDINEQGHEEIDLHLVQTFVVEHKSKSQEARKPHNAMTAPFQKFAMSFKASNLWISSLSKYDCNQRNFLKIVTLPGQSSLRRKQKTSWVRHLSSKCFWDILEQFAFLPRVLYRNLSINKHKNIIYWLTLAEWIISVIHEKSQNLRESRNLCRLKHRRTYISRIGSGHLECLYLLAYLKWSKNFLGQISFSFFYKQRTAENFDWDLKLKKPLNFAQNCTMNFCLEFCHLLH